MFELKLCIVKFRVKPPYLQSIDIKQADKLRRSIQMKKTNPL